MMQREFGADKTAWPVLGLGCSRIGSLGNPVPMRDIRALLERSLDLGVNLLDTADIYGQGDSEREIGRLLAGRRDRAFVVTKVGKLFSRKMRLMRPLKPLLKPLLARVKSAKGAVVGQRDANLATDFSPEHITAAAEDSLRRLGFDSVDALLLHSPPATEITSGRGRGPGGAEEGRQGQAFRHLLRRFAGPEGGAGNSRRRTRSNCRST